MTLADETVEVRTEVDIQPEQTPLGEEPLRPIGFVNPHCTQPACRKTLSQVTMTLAGPAFGNTL